MNDTNQTYEDRCAKIEAQVQASDLDRIDAETAVMRIRAIFDALTAIDSGSFGPLDDTVGNLAETGIRLTQDALEDIQNPKK